MSSSQTSPQCAATTASALLREQIRDSGLPGLRHVLEPFHARQHPIQLVEQIRTDRQAAKGQTACRRHATRDPRFGRVRGISVGVRPHLPFDVPSGARQSGDGRARIEATRDRNRQPVPAHLRQDLVEDVRRRPRPCRRRSGECRVGATSSSIARSTGVSPLRRTRNARTVAGSGRPRRKCDPGERTRRRRTRPSRPNRGWRREADFATAGKCVPRLDTGAARGVVGVHGPEPVRPDVPRPSASFQPSSSRWPLSSLRRSLRRRGLAGAPAPPPPGAIDLADQPEPPGRVLDHPVRGTRTSRRSGPETERPTSRQGGQKPRSGLPPPDRPDQPSPRGRAGQSRPRASRRSRLGDRVLRVAHAALSARRRLRSPS